MRSSRPALMLEAEASPGVPERPYSGLRVERSRTPSHEPKLAVAFLSGDLLAYSGGPAPEFHRLPVQRSAGCLSGIIQHFRSGHGECQEPASEHYLLQFSTRGLKSVRHPSWTRVRVSSSRNSRMTMSSQSLAMVARGIVVASLARARILLVNTKLVPSSGRPKAITDLVAPNLIVSSLE